MDKKVIQFNLDDMLHLTTTKWNPMSALIERVSANTRIDYQLIDRVLDYYINKGCQYVEAPWLISKQAEQAVGTEFISGQFLHDDRCFAGSAEQSLIELSS